MDNPPRTDDGSVRVIFAEGEKPPLSWRTHIAILALIVVLVAIGILLASKFMR